MENLKNINEWIELFESGKFESSDVTTQIEAGWYDWFCKDGSLTNKTNSLGKKLISISKSWRLDTKNQFVFFKNNCPCVGKLYDDFRICDIKTGDVVFTITPVSGHHQDGGNGSVWGKENDFKEPLMVGKWIDIKRWFNEMPM